MGSTFGRIFFFFVPSSKHSKEGQCRGYNCNIPEDDYSQHMYAATLRTCVVSHAILTLSVSCWFKYTVQFQPRAFLLNGCYTHDNFNNSLFSGLVGFGKLCFPRKGTLACWASAWPPPAEKMLVHSLNKVHHRLQNPSFRIRRSGYS